MQNITRFFFSFNGRLGRSDYWLKGILPLCGILILIGLCRSLDPLGHELQIILGIAYLTLAFIYIWASLAIQVKRCHDRNRTGWFLLIGCIPLLQLWPCIEMGFLKGTDGPNRYGEDPLS